MKILPHNIQDNSQIFDEHQISEPLIVDNDSFSAIIDQLDETAPPSERLKKTLTEQSVWGTVRPQIKTI